MKLKYIIPFFCISTLISNVNAATTEAQEKIQVLNVIKKFTESVSCGTQPISLKNIYTVERDIKYGRSTYYVLWFGNVGCDDGNASESFYITEVYRGSGNRPFTVYAAFIESSIYAFGDDIGINYRFIQDVKKINSKQFEIVSWKHADDKWGGKDGGSNFPANKFKYTLEKVGYKGWKITNQVLLEQNK